MCGDNFIRFGEDERNLSQNEVDDKHRQCDESTKKTIDRLGIKPKKNKHLFNIDSYRRIIEIRTNKGEQEMSNEELDDFCVKNFGEPFFKK